MARNEHSKKGNVEVIGRPPRARRTASPFDGLRRWGCVRHRLWRGRRDAGWRPPASRLPTPRHSAPRPGHGSRRSSRSASTTRASRAWSRHSVPTTRPDALIGPARALFGDAFHPLVAASAVCLRSGRRHILAGDHFPLADIVAASSAVPGLFPPHRIDGRLYVDGGMWSATSIDAAIEAEQVIVVAPLAGPVMGPIGRTAGILLERELRAWRRRHPQKSIVMIRPDHRIGRLAGRNPLGALRRRSRPAGVPARGGAGASLGRAVAVEARRVTLDGPVGGALSIRRTAPGRRSPRRCCRPSRTSSSG